MAENNQSPIGAIFTGIGIIAAFFAAVLVAVNWDKIFPKKETPADEGEMKCEFRNSQGELVTLTGKGADFERMCKQNQINRVYYIYGYPHRFVRWWRPRPRPL